jgi:hypothetical protein
MEQREEPVTVDPATDEERVEARAEFRRKLAAAGARMTPEKRDRVRAAFGLDSRPREPVGPGPVRHSGVRGRVGSRR